MRVCLVYDCLFPHTIGGAERWYRNLAERLAADGHDVTYLTLRQWDRGVDPDLPGVRVRAVGPRMRLYARSGRRRLAPPIVFGLGVLWHLLRHARRYQVVHTASFPYFSLLAVAATRRIGGFRVVVDWHEVWSREYWRSYLGRPGGDIGWLIQHGCARIRQHAFCFSRLHADRLRNEGLRGEIEILRGQYAGPLTGAPVVPPEPLILFAGRLIPEKRVMLALAGVAAAAGHIPGLRAVFFGDGPERIRLQRAIEDQGLSDVVAAPGVMPSAAVEAAMQHALCLVVSSQREGYGKVVVEAAAGSTPTVVVAAEDSAATELVEEGVNGVVVNVPEPDAVGAAIVRIHQEGVAMRERTARWFQLRARDLSLEQSLGAVVSSYGAPPPPTPPQAAPLARAA